MNKLKNLLFAFVTLLFLSVTLPETLHVDKTGRKLKEFYLGLNVQNLWLNGQHINWETGLKNKPDSLVNLKTHCSAFAAAACKRLDIYILRPPDHKQKLLANAQYDWLETREAFDIGWREIKGNDKYVKAQGYANNGHVVVAVCKNPRPDKPGHIALVMPEEMPLKKLAESGPTVIMAGVINYDSISLRDGFRHHFKEWPEHVIKFYCNDKKILL